MTFEEWLKKEYPGVSLALASANGMQDAFYAGAEQMREDFAAKIEQNWGKEQADLCRKFPLPVGESSRAPEGSTKS